MRINVIRIPCRNLSESMEFYEQALGLKKVYGSAEEGFIGFQLENAELLLEVQEPVEFECGRYLGFSVEVEDIYTFFRESSDRGVDFITPPQHQDWGGVIAHLHDCNGNSFSVTHQPG